MSNPLEGGQNIDPFAKFKEKKLTPKEAAQIRAGADGGTKEENAAQAVAKENLRGEEDKNKV